ncbi:hypothetical protein QYE76_069928 [Lolium multiflorum]|uniref:TF-B3 domain-containing protein n=1 Tax=Lolium multiflorum TaxID=4521 RepID=A0AAD8SIY6_LOLMU|nr:hypothetical protein QYE76_069928 [Lolium multiflorum]
MDDLADFEFFKIILEDGSRKLRLPDKFASVLDGREPREVKLREAGGGRLLWDVEVVFDGEGHMYLGRGWDQFAREYDVQRGHFLVFSYDGDAVLAVKVFDGTMCRRHYKDDDDYDSVTIKEEDPGSESSCESGSNNSIDSGGNDSIYTGSKNSIDNGGNYSIYTASKNSTDSGSKNSSSPELDVDDAPTSQFTVMLRQCHLGARQNQYLNVPADFQVAHGYAERTKVVLRMRGKSWTVNLKNNNRSVGNPRTSLRYGWHQFCVDNRLDVGDTCFFRALRGGDACRGEDHVLKVEVRKRDGTFVH